MKFAGLVLITVLAIGASAASGDPARAPDRVAAAPPAAPPTATTATTDGVAMRHAAAIMSTSPYLDIEGLGRAWLMEKSADFAVVLFEISGPIPLHTHPDGNRRMFVIEGELEMLGGTHTMRMKTGDYMYLPRNHHHRVRPAGGSRRAMFLTVDNPPVSSRNVVWIEPTPPLVYDQSQLEHAAVTQAGCNK